MLCDSSVKVVLFLVPALPPDLETFEYSSVRDVVKTHAPGLTGKVRLVRPPLVLGWVRSA